MPCKHSAAVCYVFGACLGDDPFLLFPLRGRRRHEFRRGLERMATEGAAQPAGRAPTQRPDLVPVGPFWQSGRVDVEDPDGPTFGVPGSLPERDWWRGQVALTDLLGPIPETVAAAGEALQGRW